MCGVILRVERKCVLSIAESTAESFILIDFKMSKQGARSAKPQNDQMLSYVQPKTQQQDVGMANVSTATFSSMSKQAESLVNGGNNVVVWSTVATMWSSIRTTII